MTKDVIFQWRDNLKVSGTNNTGRIEPYYTPSAILQDKAESVKYLDLKRATKKPLKGFKAVRLERGDIVITRSGTIGRVSMLTRQFNFKNVIASDNLIRVRIPDESLRRERQCQQRRF